MNENYEALIKKNAAFFRCAFLGTHLPFLPTVLWFASLLLPTPFPQPSLPLQASLTSHIA